MPKRRFEHAKGMTRATSCGEQAICTESFGNNGSRPSGPEGTYSVVLADAEDSASC
jgi:hypothetical protein